MIQRFQSVFLLITVMALAVFLGTDTYTKVISETESVVLTPFVFYEKIGNLNSGKSVFYIAALAFIALVVSAIAIFMYKNRLRQMLFVSVNSLFMMAALGVSVYFILTQARPLKGPGEEIFGTGFFALIVAMISNMIANRLIRKDEKKVRASDRMR